jgi:hypothetical protein
MIVIATNVAETSITIPGIRLVSTVCALPYGVTARRLSRVVVVIVILRLLYSLSPTAPISCLALHSLLSPCPPFLPLVLPDLTRYVVDSGRQKERVQDLSSGVSKFEVGSIRIFLYSISSYEPDQTLTSALDALTAITRCASPTTE